MHTHPSPRRDFEGMEHRRKRAARLFAAGRLILAAIARELRVSRQSVSRWYRDWRRGGRAALRGAGRAGRKPAGSPLGNPAVGPRAAGGPISLPLPDDGEGAIGEAL